MSSDDTQAVIDHHTKALLAGDVDGVMQDYTEASVFIVNLAGVFTGIDAIRGLMAASASMPGFEETSAYVEGEAAYNTWKADGVSFASDTFVVRDGKIVLQTVAMVLG